MWKNSDESEEPELPASGADQWNKKFLPGYTGEEPPYDPEWDAHLKTFSPGDRLLHQPRTEEDDPIGEAYPVIYKSPDQNYMGAHWVHNPANGQTEWTFRNSLMPYGDINDLPTYQGNYETQDGKRVWNQNWEGYNAEGNRPAEDLQAMLTALQREEARNKETGEPFDLTNVFIDAIGKLGPGHSKEQLSQLFQRAYQLGHTPIRGEGNPNTLTMDEGHNIVYPEGQAEQMGFHEAPAQVQMKTPGWGGYTAPPWGGQNADGSFTCQSCGQRTKFDDWNGITPTKGGTLPCSHCGYPLANGHFPRTDSHPGYVHDPRFPGYQRWTNNATFECPCWYGLNEPMKRSEPDPNCPKCHGSGTVVVPHNPHTDGSNGQFRLDPRFDLVQPPAQGFGEERYGAAEEKDDDELHVGLAIPERIQKKIKAWCDSQDWPKGTELEDPSEYHITLLYVSEGHEENQDSDWIRHTEGYEVKVAGIDEFGEEPDSKATVLRIESDDVIDHANDLQDAAENRGLPLKRFPGGYKAHLTVAYGPGKPKYARTPDLKFQTGASSVSTPRAKKEANIPQIAANEGYSPMLDFLHAPETRDAPTQGVQQPSRSGGHRGGGDGGGAFGPIPGARRAASGGQGERGADDDLHGRGLRARSGGVQSGRGDRDQGQSRGQDADPAQGLHQRPAGLGRPALHMGAAGRPAPRLAAHRSDTAPARHRVGWQQDWDDAWVPTDDDLSLDHDLSGDDFDRVFRQRYNQPVEMRPYGRGQNGKGLIGRDGTFHSWSVDDTGFPHHDQISQQYKIPYDAKVDVLPSGKAWVQDWETRMPVDQAYAHIQQQGKRHGIYPASGGAGYFSSLLEEAAERNETTLLHPGVLGLVPESVPSQREGNQLLAQHVPLRSESVQAVPRSQRIALRERQGMAIRPGDLQGLIERYGPYAYHVTPEISERSSILKNGLLPWDHPDNPQGTAYVDHLTPRPGHVYMSLQPPGGVGSLGYDPTASTVAIDLRKLDPRHINPDEDAAYRPEHPDSGAWSNVPPELWPMLDEMRQNGQSDGFNGSEGNKPWGQTAEEHGFGDNPDHTTWGINELANIAYRGVVPPSALIPMEQVDQNQRAVA